MSTLIKGGTVVTAEGTLEADVLIVGEKIAALLARDEATDAATFAAARAAADAEPDADVLIDATGRYVIPGGIDAHTHMEMPFGGTFSADTFETGTKAAAWGGTTTIIDFAVQAKGTSLLATLDKWHEKADGNCAIDYGFHMIVSDVNDATLKEMDGLHRRRGDQLQDVHGLPGRVLRDRRRDPARRCSRRPGPAPRS